MCARLGVPSKTDGVVELKAERTSLVLLDLQTALENWNHLHFSEDTHAQISAKSESDLLGFQEAPRLVSWEQGSEPDLTPE